LRPNTEGKDSQQAWNDSAQFLKKHGWMLLAGCAVLGAMHFGFRRKYRVAAVKKQGYEMMGGANQRTALLGREHVPGRGGASTRNQRSLPHADEFQQWESDSDSSVDNGPDDEELWEQSSEISVDQIASEYDRYGGTLILCSRTGIASGLLVEPASCCLA
jgi:hypothetical protein